MLSRRTILILFAAALLLAVTATPAFAEEDTPHADAILLSFNPFGPIIGLYTGSVEFPVADDVTLAIEPEYFNWRWSLVSLFLDSLDEEYKNTDFNMTSYGARVGLNFFPEGANNGFFVGGLLGYGRLGIRYEGFDIGSNILQGAVRGGYRAIFGPIAVSPFAEFNLSRVTTDFSEIFEALELTDDTFQDTIEDSYGFNFRWGIALAIALY